ncbi:hypothetical protein A5784_23155 [Mycobacterium sp. 852013-50091_SCH5140682]|uniref:hypothetical protein n=1 Tax=Mycobacterium sp. 852013-50091_SCH5140682 TaxID=1834109 RepID=UPI0007E93B64|nr:hypothetical protein [Mycobacterium sp. 852013-50091_SCH5140682]OBB98841.1 hypothetical protein A5784_23155 [Mycobacterium sp. 852013-50091_SCH5140682]
MRRAVIVAFAAPLLCTPVQAHADDPVLHRVTYKVSAESQVTADIYYREVDPPTWADYSHNPYEFSPKVEATIGPDQPWVIDVMLADPDQWAMVAATSGRLPTTPVFHCELAVDGVSVTSSGGPKGALCALRHW